MEDNSAEARAAEEDRIHQLLDEAERARRTRLLGTLLFVLFTALVALALTALAVGVFSATYDPGPRLIIIAVCGVSCIISYGLLRGGWLRGASWVFFLGSMAAVALAVFLIGFRGPESILFLILIVMSGMLISGRASMLLGGLSILLYAGVIAGELWGLYTPPLQLDAESSLFVTVGVRAVSFGLMGLTAWFFARNLQEAMQQAGRQAAAAQEKNVELESLREDLERRVIERTQALTQALETVAALSAPVIPVTEDVFILPLVGHVDEERMHRVIASLLAGIRTHRARIAILDITGLVTVDTTVATHLVEAAQAARLLGCELVLVGVRAEVARSLVGLDVDLSAVITQANLQSGIEYAQRALKASPAKA